MTPDRRDDQSEFDLLADNVPAMLAYIGADERYRFVNERYSEAFGQARGQIIGRSVREAIGDAWYVLVHEQIAQALAGSHVDFEIAFPRPPGKPLWLAVIHVPHRNDAGEVDGFYAFATDVTARHEAEEEIRRQRGRLAHALRVHTAGEIATAWAHEVTQPLNAITNFVGACIRRIRSGNPDPGRLLELLDAASEQGLRAGRIVHRVRHFVRADESKRSEADLRDIVRDACALLEAQSQSVAVELELPKRRLPVHCDYIQVQQACMNLLQNALEAMAKEENGSRSIEVRVARARKGFVEVTILDQGVGLGPTPDNLAFDSFHTTKPGGLGLGLSITKSIVEAHGGSVALSTRTDGVRGASARLRLPLAEDLHGEGTHRGR